MLSKHQFRILLFVVAASCVGVLWSSAASFAGDVSDRYESGAGEGTLSGDVTVVTTSPRSSGDASIAAFDAGGDVIYYNESHDWYFDVDPVPGTVATVEYIAQDHESDCPVKVLVCKTIRIVRTDLLTGESNTVYSFIAQGRGDWHDVDRIGDDRYIVADISQNRVFVFNTTSGLITWEYEVRTDFDRDTGGVFPRDWTHMNDVEHLHGGTVMVNLRNQDQVIFVNKTTGFQPELTLGAEDNHSILYEQHNPDFIPASRGGPAVIVADSENGRVIEYQRTETTWRETWQWGKNRLRWPRDADRLPNGHTLITDSNGNRVIEINETGDIIWEIPIDTPYEAERLGSGDESTGGYAAAALNLQEEGNQEMAEKPAAAVSGLLSKKAIRGVTLSVKELVPEMLVNILIFALPPWIGVHELWTIMFLGTTLTCWVGVELRWSRYRLQLPIKRG